MNMPSSLAGWCTFLFFLCYGLSVFLSGMAILGTLTAIFALGAAVFTIIGR